MGTRRGRAAPRSGSCTSPVVPDSSIRRNASRCTSPSRPVMPKSKSTVRPLGCTSRLPPCRSPWKTPWIIAPSRHAMSPARSTALVSTPASCMDADVVEREAAQPLHHEDARGDQLGVRARHHHRALVGDREHAGEVEHVLGLEPEVELLDDLLREQLDERRRVGERGDRDPPDQLGRQPRQGTQVVVRTSAATRGRCTFTTTSSPVTRRAAWTCAIDAAASGSSANSANTSSSGRPSSRSTTAADVGERLGRAPGRGGA